VEVQADAPETEAGSREIETNPVTAASLAHDIATATPPQPPGAAAEPSPFGGVSAIELERIPYEACPLCREAGYRPYRQVKTELVLEMQTVRTRVPWVRCSRCSHVFTSGYFAGDSCTRGLKSSLRWRSSLRRALASRSEASRVVAAITTLRESAAGRWLDVGCSYSGVVAVASEFGYDSAGVECCAEAAERFSDLGYAVVAGSLFDCNEGPFDVVSFSGIVDSMPFPVQALRHAHGLLAPHGLIYVCAPTSDGLRWRKLDAEDANPYWGRLDRYHVFNRKSLFRLLQTAGFEPCSYGASGSDGVGMEVIGYKR
jgi:SAM-dependent methyltransferase